MNFNDLTPRQEHMQDEKLAAMFKQFQRLLEELEAKTLNEGLANFINECIADLNTFEGPAKEARKRLRNRLYAILRRLEKEHKIVPKGYYRQHWTALGMTVYGIPFGVIEMAPSLTSNSRACRPFITPSMSVRVYTYSSPSSAAMSSQSSTIRPRT